MAARCSERLALGRLALGSALAIGKWLALALYFGGDSRRYRRDHYVVVYD
jgi:hypothetical protein